MDNDEQRRWRDADAALDRLLDLPSEQRGAALSTLPASVRELTSQLLAAHERAGILDRALQPPLAPPADAAAPHVAEAPRQIGPWRLGEVLGRGGMSVVYAAERGLPAGTQHAALKLLTVAALAADGRRRFLREHQVLARLTHPRIAALLDAGVLDDGTPYLAMQRVDGVRIDRWCRERALPPRAIVGLFLQVCEAVAHAHRQLVVHRDLKPANILVDDEGGVRLLDFGIARLLDGAAGEEDTRTEFRALTPQYAAPEQFRGEDSGTAADVFGLGAVLYQLLAGRPPRLPQQGHDTGITQPSRAVATVEGLGPQRRAQLARQLRGDLDAILLKALEAEPARRYPDAASLAQDLERWLAGRPVQAARAGRGYRLRKFIARHRIGIAAASLVGLAVLGGVASTLWYDARVRDEAERTGVVKDFLLEIFRASGPEQARGTDPPASELLRAGAARVQQELGQRPRLLAEVLQVIGGIQLDRGLIDDARQSLDAALALFDGPARGMHASHDQALLSRAIVEYELGSPAGAAERLRALHQRVLSRDGPTAPKLWAVEIQLADMLSIAGDNQAARRTAEAARLRIEQHGEPATDPEYPSALRVLAMTRVADRDLGGAITLLQIAAEAQQALDPEAPMNATIANDLGIALWDSGRRAEAEQANSRALAAHRRIYGDVHPTTVTTATNAAMVRAELGQVAEAAALMQQVLDNARALYGEGPHVELAHVLAVTALLRWQGGAPAAARELAAQATTMLAALPEEDAATLRWAAVMPGLLDMELGGAVADVPPLRTPCAPLEQTSFLMLRACVVQAWTAAAQGRCMVPEASPPEPPASTDTLWWSAWWALQSRCSTNPAARDNAAQRAATLRATLAQPPAWLTALPAEPPGGPGTLLEE